MLCCALRADCSVLLQKHFAVEHPLQFPIYGDDFQLRGLAEKTPLRECPVPQWTSLKLIAECSSGGLLRDECNTFSAAIIFFLYGLIKQRPEQRVHDRYLDFSFTTPISTRQSKRLSAADTSGHKCYIVAEIRLVWNVDSQKPAHHIGFTPKYVARTTTPSDREISAAGDAQLKKNNSRKLAVLFAEVAA